jgi:hypothetical protein
MKQSNLLEEIATPKLINQIFSDFFQTYEHQNTDEGREFIWTQPAQTDAPSKPSA